MSSDPTWLPDGDSFVYEADAKHMGVFSVTMKRTTILAGTVEKSVTACHGVAGSEILVSSTLDDARGSVVGVSVPQLERDLEFHLPWPVLDVQSKDGRRYYCTGATEREPPPVVVVDAQRQEARWGGFVRGEFPRYLTFVDDGAAWIGIEKTSRVWRRSLDGKRTPLFRRRNITSAAPCGSDVAVTIWDGGRILAERLDLGGRRLSVFNNGRPAVGPTCSADGRTVFFSDLSDGASVVRCADERCSVVAKVLGGGLSLSTDGGRLAFVDVSNRGMFVRWLDARGGAASGLIPTDTACTPQWSSEKDLWISRRHGRRLVWTEIDTNTLQPTGRTMPGTRDCSDGVQDPAAPVLQAIELEQETTSRVRLLSNKDLRATEAAR